MIKTRLALFVSGTGSNALNIIDHFSENEAIDVAFVMTNKSNSPVIAHCAERSVSCFVYSNEIVSDGIFLTSICQEQQIDYIILAGYLRLIPSELIENFPERIMNIHPALLPKYGGKGMYGDRVHAAVIAAKEKESGISIHFVDARFDEGRMIAQAYCKIDPTDTPESLRKKIQQLEHAYFPVVIEKTILLKS